MLSLMLALIGGSILWLLLGDRFPLDRARDRWPTVHNIAAYSVLLLWMRRVLPKVN